MRGAAGAGPGRGRRAPLDRDFVRALPAYVSSGTGCCWWTRCRPASGRTGNLFAFQQYGIAPDAVSPCQGHRRRPGPWAAPEREKCRPVLGPGTTASTFGGNPVCSGAALAVLDCPGRGGP